MGTRNVKMDVLLTDNANNPLSGKSITFKYKLSTATDWTTAGTQNTDTDGKASMTINLTVPNTYDFRAEFAGDTNYDASYDEELGLLVKSGTVLALTVTPL
jgi:hypothetical protein